MASKVRYQNFQAPKAHFRKFSRLFGKLFVKNEVKSENLGTWRQFLLCFREEIVFKTAIKRENMGR